MAWTGPISTPPDGNTPTPVNVGTTDQVKNGGLGLDALSVFGTGYVEKLKINETGDTGAWELYTNGDTYTSGTLRTDGILQANNGISVDGNTVIDDGAGWHRTYGKTGWINQTYGGGWYMTDTTWLRSYANKSIYTSGTMRADTDMRSAKYCDVNGANCKTTSQMGGSCGAPYISKGTCQVGTNSYVNYFQACEFRICNSCGCSSTYTGDNRMVFPYNNFGGWN